MIHLVLLTTLLDLSSIMYFNFSVINDIPVPNFVDCTNCCSNTLLDYCKLLIIAFWHQIFFHCRSQVLGLFLFTWYNNICGYSSVDYMNLLLALKQENVHLLVREQGKTTEPLYVDIYGAYLTLS